MPIMLEGTERVPIESHAQWLELRAPLITASAIPAICGEESYGSAAAYWAEKKGVRPPQPDSPVLRRGRWGEASAFEAAAEELPHLAFTRARVFFRNATLGLGATPDGFFTEPDRPGLGLIQTKTIARSRFRAMFLVDQADAVDTGDAEPPAAMVLQTLTEMMLSGADRGLLVVLVVGEYSWDFRAFPLERNEELEARILHKAQEFWDNYLIPGIMPPFDYGRDQELIRLLYQEDAGTELDLTTDNRAAAAVEDLLQIQTARKRLGDEENKLKAELQAKLGEHTYGRLNDGRRISWKFQSSNVKAHTREGRVFRVLKS